MVVILSIDYTEFRPETYRGVILSLEGKRIALLSSGVPQTDYLAALEVASIFGKWVIHSSTVDHFVMDGGILTVQETQ